MSEYWRLPIPRWGASLSFYTLLSLPPMLMLGFTLLRKTVGSLSVNAEIAMQKQLVFLLGRQLADFVFNITQNVLANRGGVGLTVLGIITAFVSASGVVSELQESFNAIWRVESKPKTSSYIIQYLRKQLLAMVSIAAIGVVIILNLAATITLRYIGSSLEHLLPEKAFLLLKISNFLVSYVFFFFTFAIFFKVLPDVRIKWRHVWLGAAVTTAFFGIGRFLIVSYLYVGKTWSSYGVAGSLVIFLLWIFYSSQILLLGGVFTKLWNDSQNQHIPPRYYAKQREECD